MKTWQAILLHSATGILQALAASTIAAGLPAQIGLQTGLLLVQGVIAKKNSQTAPNGAKLTETVEGGFVAPPKGNQ